MSRIVRHRPSLCLKCGYTLNSSSTTQGERPPEPNDFTLCFACGHLMTYNSDMSVRELNEVEQAEANECEEVNEVRRQLAEMRAIREAAGIPFYSEKQTRQ